MRGRPGPRRARSRPERLCPCKSLVGMARFPEHGRTACLLMAGKTTGSKRFAGATRTPVVRAVLGINEALCEPLVHRDVVEIAKGVLKLLQAEHEPLAAARGFLAGKGLGKVFRGITKLLRLNPQFVASLGAERLQVFAAFEDSLPAPMQLLCGRRRNRALPQCANERVILVRPLPGLDPCRSVKNQGAKAWRFDRRKGTGKGIPALFLKISCEHRHARSVRVAVRDRLQDAL